MLSMFFLDIQNALKNTLLVFNGLFYLFKFFQLVNEVIVLVHEFNQIVISRLPERIGIVLSHIFHPFKLFLQMIAPLLFNTHQSDESVKLLLLRTDALTQSLLILLICFEQIALQSHKTTKQILSTSSKLAVEFIIISLQVAAFLFAFKLCLVALGNSILKCSICLFPTFDKRLILVTMIFNSYFQLLPADEQVLVLQVFLPNLVLCNDGGKRPLWGSAFGTRLTIDRSEGYQDGEGVAGTLHIQYFENG